MWFDSWSDLGRLLAVGPLAYFALVAALRTSGARTLSKLNAFDLVVTVALGSTLATVLLNTDVSLTEGVLGLVVLVALQYAVSHLRTDPVRVVPLSGAWMIMVAVRARGMADRGAPASPATRR